MECLQSFDLQDCVALDLSYFSFSINNSLAGLLVNIRKWTLHQGEDESTAYQSFACLCVVERRKAMTFCQVKIYGSISTYTGFNVRICTFF